MSRALRLAGYGQNKASWPGIALDRNASERCPAGIMTGLPSRLLNRLVWEEKGNNSGLKHSLPSVELNSQSERDIIHGAGL